MPTLSEWIISLASDVALLTGLQASASKNGASQARNDSIKAAQERIRQAQAKIDAMKRH